MSDKVKRYTLQDIAARTGFGRSTVSLALRNHPSLPEATRKTIQEAAEEMGYRPNPLISALMTQIRDKRKKHRERIALISRFDGPLKTKVGQQSFYSILYESIVEQAARRGYDVEDFHFDPKAPLSDRRLSEILISRGIHGVLFFPGNNLSRESDYPTLQWEHFAVVLIGYNTRHIGLHQITSHYSYDMDMALRHAAAANLHPVGLAISRHHNTVTGFSWISRYLLYQSSLPQKQRIPPLHLQDFRDGRTDFIQWFEKYRPKILLVSEHVFEEWLQQAGYRIPEDVRLILLVVRGEHRNLAGVAPGTDQVGRAAVELLVTLLQTNQLGLPEFPQTVSIKGHWTHGYSFPQTDEELQKVPPQLISSNRTAPHLSAQAEPAKAKKTKAPRKP